MGNAVSRSENIIVNHNNNIMHIMHNNLVQFTDKVTLLQKERKKERKKMVRK